MLIRVGHRGFNTDQLVHWTYEPALDPEPEPESEPSPAPPPGDVSTGDIPQEPLLDDGRLPGTGTYAATTTAPEEPGPQGTATLTLVFTTGDVTLEGDEADKLLAYLNSKTGAVL